MSPPTKAPTQTELVPATVEPPQGEDSLVLMFERLAKDPAVDPDKLEKLIGLQERILRHNAKAAFEGAFAQMAPKIPEIDEKGRIIVKGTVRSTYAPLEDIHKAIKPILAEHGFAIRHRTEWPDDRGGIIRIVGILSHRDGHSEESSFEAPMDKSEYRTDIQSMGSTVSYGRRYTTIDLLNISTRGVDNDGATAGRPQPPEGYAEWLDRLVAGAERGLGILQAGWQDSKPEFKNFAVAHDKDRWEKAKARGREVDRGAKA